MLSIAALIVVCCADLALALAVLLNNSRARVNQVFAGMVIVLATWNIIVFLEDTALGRLYIQPLATADFALASVLIGLLFWFCRELVGIRKTKYDSWLIFCSVFILALIITGQASQAQLMGDDVILEPKIGFIPFVAYMLAFLVGGLSLLLQKYRQTKGKKHAQLKFINIGLLLTVSGLILAYVIMPRVFDISNPDMTRAGIYSSLFFIGFSAYAIIRHRFLDIRALVARSASYTLLLGLLAALYGFTSYVISSSFMSRSSSPATQSIAYTVMSVILVFAFQPLRRLFEHITDRIFYRDRYDSQVVLDNFTKILVSELDLDRILKRSISELCETLRVGFGQIIVFNHDRVYRISHYGVLPRRLMVAPELARLNHPMIIADELTSGERKYLMERHGIRLSMTLRTRDEFIGYVLLGDKLSGSTYSTQDVKLLEIIGKELAVAIQNAKAYAQIQEFNLTLQARIDHATNRLRVANRHLKELDHAKDEFISMASHQLRTPLTTIKGYLSMLLEGDAGHITKTQAQFVNYAFGASERMVNLISDLLNVSRLSAGRFLIQTKPTDMVQMISDEVRQLTSHATAKGLQLVFDRPAESLPLVEIDENKTRQVIMNFIDNAIYYTQTGEVRVVLVQSGDHVRLEVRDTGIGVPRDAQRRLFTKFYRADNAQTIRPDGTGLGLYLAKRVIEDQGGTIVFNSQEGVGSTFGFELPFKPAKVKHEDKHARPKSKSRQ